MEKQKAVQAQRKRQKAKKQSAESIAKKTNSPQMWLTLMWHVSSGLPWDWRTGPSDSSERGRLEEMLANLPSGSLTTADAGFVGYEFGSRILGAGRHFVIRVGGNVTLVKDLGYARRSNHFLCVAHGLTSMFLACRHRCASSDVSGQL